MKIGIFLATTSEKPEKKKYLEAFGAGINIVNKDTVFFTKAKEYANCDIAVIFGFYGVNLGEVHHIRKHIYTEHTKKNKKCIFIDADLFKHSGKFDSKINTHVRISYDSIFFDKAKHFNEKSDSIRWNILKEQKGINLLNYRETGEHILLCLNSNPFVGKGWSAGKLNVYDWAEEMIREIRKYSDRKILMRFHPNVKTEDQKKIPIDRFIDLDNNLYFSGGVAIKSRKFMPRTSLQDDCKDAWACVVHNTSASVIPVLCGIPVFTTQKSCPVYNIANHDFKSLPSPQIIPREQWLYDTAYCLWSDSEMQNGIVWKRFRKFI